MAEVKKLDDGSLRIAGYVPHVRYLSDGAAEVVLDATVVAQIVECLAGGVKETLAAMREAGKGVPVEFPIKTFPTADGAFVPHTGHGNPVTLMHHDDEHSTRAGALAMHLLGGLVTNDSLNLLATPEMACDIAEAMLETMRERGMLKPMPSLEASFAMGEMNSFVMQAMRSKK